MKLISTKSVFRGARLAPGGAPAGGRWRPPQGGVGNRRVNPRGTAEIELMLVIPLLLALLFLAGGALVLAKARMANEYNAENDVYTQVVSGVGFSPANDPVPPDGINAVKPALPNRYALASEQQAATINATSTPLTVNLSEQAILTDPAWDYASWPIVSDRPALNIWFDAYVGESHPADVVQALGLQPAGPP